MKLGRFDVINKFKSANENVTFWNWIYSFILIVIHNVDVLVFSSYQFEFHFINQFKRALYSDVTGAFRWRLFHRMFFALES